jgi:hypothetical protein
MRKFIWLKNLYFDKYYARLSLSHNLKFTIHLRLETNNGIILHMSLNIILELPGMGYTIIDIKIKYETKEAIHIHYKIKLFLIAKICTLVTLNLIT